MLVVVLGGVRSGKSDLAEAWAARLAPPVTYVATGAASDPSMARRIDAHRRRRPSTWTTVEVGGADLPTVLTGLRGTVLVDALGSWLAGRPDFSVDGESLVVALRQRTGDTVVVSDEVGLSVHPPTAVGVAFQDALGTLNRQVCGAADRAVLAVAGRAVPLVGWEDLWA